MKLGTGDTPEQADQNAWDACTIEARAQTIAKLIAGHGVFVVDTNDDKKITLHIGDVTFEDLREEYPSEKLMANIALAMDAAKVNPAAFNIGDMDDETLKRFDPRTSAAYRDGNTADFVYDLARSELEEVAQANIRREATKRGQLSPVELRADGIKW